MCSAFAVNKTTYDEKTKIWHGVKRVFTFGPECSIGQASLDALLKAPEHIAQICHGTGRQFTNAEVARLSVQVAQHFKALQIKQREVIGLIGANSDYVAPLFIGAMLAGLVMSTLDPSFDKADIKHIYSITKPKLLFCDGAVYDRVKAAFDDISNGAVIYTMKDHIKGVPQITEFLNVNKPDAAFVADKLELGYLQTAVILCSSGTTGLPKGVCLSHAALLNFEFLDVDPHEKLFTFSTLFWISGLWMLFAGTFHAATRVTAETGYSPEEFCRIIEKHKISTLIAPPSQLAQTVASPTTEMYDLTSVKTFYCGGSAVPYSVVQKMRSFMPTTRFITAYGMTEAAGLLAFGDSAADGLIGQLAANTVLKVIDDTGRLLGPDKAGEICFRSMFPWRGYYNNTAATKAAYDDVEHWFKSGDIGYMDLDGNLVIIDRKKDILKYNNFHYNPTEVEGVIWEMSGIIEVCVCGIPNAATTTLPAAAIVKQPECALTEQDVYEFVASRLAHFKHLRGGVYFLNALPKTASGKNLRREVTSICEKIRSAKNDSHIH